MFSLAVVLLAFPLLYISIRKHGRTPVQTPHVKSTGAERSRARPDPEICSLPYREPASKTVTDCDLYKSLFLKLQNLEKYPDVIPSAKNVLVSLLSQSTREAHRNPEKGILSLSRYSKEDVLRFVHHRHNVVTKQFEKYNVRRQLGGPREMFPDRDDAIKWLRKMAPIKLIDGAWLGHIFRVSTPYELWPVMKRMCEIFSEELGDGLLERNHVFLYRKLLKSFDPKFPDPTSEDFSHPRHGASDPNVWKAATTQLLVSLFPHEFLPEILGYNLCFEELTLETLIAAKELREVGLDPYYFHLHISIDNLACGHMIMAVECIEQYMAKVSNDGEAAMQSAWKRIQAGFILGDESGGARGSIGSTLAGGRLPTTSITELEAEICAIFQSKILAAEGIHCSSRAKIGKRSLVEWLNPKSFSCPRWQTQFLESLKSSVPWVYEGDSDRSRLVRELRWGGRMFGAFTEAEIRILECWIDALKPFYFVFTDQPVSAEETPSNGTSFCDYPIPVQTTIEPLKASAAQPNTHVFQKLTRASKYSFDLDLFLPIWFAQSCLLANFVSVPARTATESGSAVVSLLRVQLGFAPPGLELTDAEIGSLSPNTGIMELGLEIMERFGLERPTNLAEIINARPSTFVKNIMALSIRPVANFAILLGLTYAFVDLQEIVLASGLLSTTSNEKLEQMITQQRESLQTCVSGLAKDQVQYKAFCVGYGIGGAQAKGCYSEQ